MNLVEQIKDQFTSEMLSQVGSLIGMSDTQAKSALGSAIPALLSAFSGLASGSGADKLVSAINAAGSSVPGRFAADLASNPNETLEQGAGMLESLFGGSTLGGLAATLAKFLGSDSGQLKKLLAIAGPFILGAISRQMQGKPATTQGLKNLFAEQKSNIAAAIPSGLSLAGIPGLPDLQGMANSAAATVRQTAATAQDASSSLVKTLLPIGALALLALLGWQIFRNRTEQPAENVAKATPTTVNRPNLDAVPAIPVATQITEGLKSVFTDATTILEDVKDEATAETALPKLENLNLQLDALSKLWKTAPADARTAIIKFTQDSLGKLTELIERIKELPAVGEKLTPTLDSLVDKLKVFDEAQ